MSFGASHSQDMQNRMKQHRKQQFSQKKSLKKDLDELFLVRINQV